MTITGSEFRPQFKYIAAITNAYPAVITFTEPHQFSSGGIISLRVYPDNVIRGLNLTQMRILSTTSDTVTVDFDTTNLGTFVYNASFSQPALAVPVGSGLEPNPNSIFLNTVPPTIGLTPVFDNMPG